MHCTSLFIEIAMCTEQVLFNSSFHMLKHFITNSNIQQLPLFLTNSNIQQLPLYLTNSNILQLPLGSIYTSNPNSQIQWCRKMLDFVWQTPCWRWTTFTSLPPKYLFGGAASTPLPTPLRYVSLFMWLLYVSKDIQSSISCTLFLYY